MESTDMFTTKWHCSVPKIMQIGTGIVRMWWGQTQWSVFF